MDTRIAPDLTVTELVDCLRQLDAALESGDVEAARLELERTRRKLLAGPDRSSRHLDLVGGVRLTDREAATLGLLPDGSMSQKDIARALRVSPNTIKTHLKAIYQKLGVHGRGEAIHRARELGLLAGPASANARRHEPALVAVRPVERVPA